MTKTDAVESNVDCRWIGQRALDAARISLPASLAVSLAEAACGRNEKAPLITAPDGTVHEIHRRLGRGPGFAVISGFRHHDDIDIAREQVRLFSSLVGVLTPQDVAGTIMYDVLDKGAAVEQGARFSITNRATGFHTDNSFEAAVPRYVGLYCVRAAPLGGETQLVSGYTVLEKLLAANPQAAFRLQRPFLFDRRGGVAAGELPFSEFPVLSLQQPTIVVRYLRYYIECGYEVANRTLDHGSRLALDEFDAACSEPAIRVALTLSPDEMLMVNNYCILHARTQYEDSGTSKRHLIRVWIEGGPYHESSGPTVEARS